MKNLNEVRARSILKSYGIDFDRYEQSVSKEETIEIYSKNIKDKLDSFLFKGSITQSQYDVAIKELNDLVEKGGKKGTVGEVREWDGKKYQKQANGKWLEVRGGLTAKQHQEGINKHPDTNYTEHPQKTWHENQLRGLSDKEHSDEEIGIKNEKKHNDYKKVNFPGDDTIYYVVGEKGDNYKVVIDEKIKHYESTKGTEKEDLYAETIPKSEFEENNSLKKSDDGVKIDKEEFVKEHENLVDTLKHGSKEEREEEAEDQKEELNKEIKKPVMNEKVEKALNILKSGEGSRGGHVIGHTKSGKPIYDNANHESHKNFTIQDHDDAIDVHSVVRNNYHYNNRSTEKDKEDNDYAFEQQKHHIGNKNRLLREKEDNGDKKKDNKYKIGQKVTIIKSNYSQVTGVIINVNERKTDVNLGNGVKGKEKNVFVTIKDENGKEHIGSEEWGITIKD